MSANPTDQPQIIGTERTAAEQKQLHAQAALTSLHNAPHTFSQSWLSEHGTRPKETDTFDADAAE